MTLSFHEIGLRWPDACVYWDRDVAPTLDWSCYLMSEQPQSVFVRSTT